MNVFVYGTLKRGQGNHGFLREAEFLGEYVTAPRYTMYDLGVFPAVTRKGETGITGEVYKIDRDILKSLDRLEGYPNYYDREIIATPYGLAWIYFMPKEHLDDKSPTVRTGVW